MKQPKFESARPIVIDLEDPRFTQERLRLIEAYLPEALEYYASNRFGSHYVDNGKDGYIFELLNPNDHGDRSMNDVLVKVWEPAFLTREHEINILRRAGSIRFEHFKVPRLLTVDPSMRGFAMERIPGKTAHELLFKQEYKNEVSGRTQSGRKIDRGFYEDIGKAFRELNKNGICHADAHFRNYLIVDSTVDQDNNGNEVLVDGKVYIIDFGRSVRANTPERDLYQIKSDLSGKVIDFY